MWSRARRGGEAGFTLIELLVVVIIIGILASIAIPTFLKQRERAWQRALKADLHNNAVKMEEYANDNVAYPAGDPGGRYAFKQSLDDAPTEVMAVGQFGFCLRVESLKDFNPNVFWLDSQSGTPAPGEDGEGNPLAAFDCSTKDYSIEP